MNMFQDLIGKVKNYLVKTSDALSAGIISIFKNKKLDVECLNQLKELLIATDLDYKTTQILIDELAHEKFNKEITHEEVKSFLAERMLKILLPLENKIECDNIFHILMFCGINGNGKTTTIAKLAHKFKGKNKTLMFAPCDTFRAAAEEQLAVWAKKVGCKIFINNSLKDPASVAYQAVLDAKQNKIDMLFVDTAGRLHTNVDLMDQLKKISSVIKKCAPEAKYEVILVLDATVGKNALNQIKTFKEAVNIDGLIISKLDGTAKAGMIISIARDFPDIKIYAIGIGESIDDLQNFSAKSFIDNLLDINKII